MSDMSSPLSDSSWSERWSSPEVEVEAQTTPPPPPQLQQQQQQQSTNEDEAKVETTLEPTMNESRATCETSSVVADAPSEESVLPPPPSTITLQATSERQVGSESPTNIPEQESSNDDSDCESMPKREPVAADEVTPPPTIAAHLSQVSSSLRATHDQRDSATIACIAAMSSKSRVLTRLRWLAEYVTEGALPPTLSFTLEVGGRSLLGELLNLAAKGYALSTSCDNTGGRRFQTSSHTKAHTHLMSVRQRLMPMLRQARLTHSERVAQLRHVIQNCATRPCEDTDQLMHEIIQAVLGGDTSTKDVTLALIRACLRSRLDLACDLLSHKGEVAEYGCVANPFASDSFGRTLRSVLKAGVRPKGRPLQVSVILALLDQAEAEVTEHIAPAVQTILPQLGVRVDPELPPAELALIPLEYVDHAGQPTEALQQLMADQPPPLEEAVASSECCSCHGYGFLEADSSD